MWNSLFKADAWLVPISARCIKDSAGLLRNIPLEKFSPNYFNTFSQDHICKVGKNIFRNSCWRGFPIIFTISWCFLIGRLTQYIIYCMSRWNYSVSYFVRSFIFNGEKCVGISARRDYLWCMINNWWLIIENLIRQMYGELSLSEIVPTNQTLCYQQSGPCEHFPHYRWS